MRALYAHEAECRQLQATQELVGGAQIGLEGPSSASSGDGGLRAGPCQSRYSVPRLFPFVCVCVLFF